MLFASVGQAIEADEVLDTFGVERFDAKGDGPLLLWLPSEQGFWGTEQSLAQSLREQGVSVWLVDLHTGAFADPGAGSLSQFDNSGLDALLALAIKQGKPVYLIAYARGAVLALRAAVRWHAQSGSTPLAGALLFSPVLASDRVIVGAEMTFDPVVGKTRLPLYILQPQRSGGRWRLPTMANALGVAGSAVYQQILPGLRDGYHGDPRASQQEVAQRKHLPGVLASAMRALRAHKGWALMAQADPEIAKAAPRSKPVLGLQELPVKPAGALRLPLMDGRVADLRDYKGQVVLLSFWATWCPPCVEELPSLNRLAKTFGPQGFTVLGVDVGETPEEVQAFLRDVPVEFPNMLDSKAQAAAKWQVHAFPTSYVLDRQGQLRLGYVGALDWQSPQNSGPIQDLLLETIAVDAE